MISRRLSLHLFRVHRRAIAAASLATYLAAIIGLPVPVLNVASHDASTPFPCQHHRCGCATAEQCWRSCCCFSPRERLAWARAHGVTIPPDALAALECAAGAGDEHAGCCSSSGDPHVVDGHACAQCAAPEDCAGVRWVSGWQAQKCQGLALVWLTIGASLPVEKVPAWEFDWLPVGRVCAADGAFSPLPADLDVPPPRAA